MSQSTKEIRAKMKRIILGVIKPYTKDFEVYEKYTITEALDLLEELCNQQKEEAYRALIAEIEKFHDKTYEEGSKGTSEELAYRTALLELLAKLKSERG